MVKLWRICSRDDWMAVYLGSYNGFASDWRSTVVLTLLSMLPWFANPPDLLLGFYRCLFYGLQNLLIEPNFLFVEELVSSGLLTDMTLGLQLLVYRWFRMFVVWFLKCGLQKVSAHDRVPHQLLSGPIVLQLLLFRIWNIFQLYDLNNCILRFWRHDLGLLVSGL